MIHKITADKPSFRDVEFKSGLNIILADQATNSDDRESRNGLGKSSLIEVIHFCLGADLKDGKGLDKRELLDWTFSLEFDAPNKVCVSRNTSNKSIVTLSGDYSTWIQQPEVNKDCGRAELSVTNLKEELGYQMFNLPKMAEKYAPSYRQLIPFFVRRGRDGYNSPFEYTRSRKSWQVQVSNAYLLGLSWEHAREWQLLKDREEEIASLKKVAKTDLFKDIIGGTIGELEALKLQLEDKSARNNSQLQSFHVHSQYKELESIANDLTSRIHTLSNKRIKDSKMIEYYEGTLKSEEAASIQELKDLYKSVGVEFSNDTLIKLDEAEEFHKAIILNRAQFLSEEIERLKSRVSSYSSEIEQLSNKRAEKLQILQSHGALDEYQKLQENALKTTKILEEIKQRIENLKKFEEETSKNKIAKEVLKQAARRDYHERSSVRDEAVHLFNEYSQALYNTPGKLIVDIGDAGYKFSIEIERADSDGIQLMEIFCFDLMLASIWSKKNRKPGFLVHDSTLFADVDERQIVLAIELAKNVSEKYGFQYICCLNSDKVPNSKFTKDFRFENYIRLELKDNKPENSLFGFRF